MTREEFTHTRSDLFKRLRHPGESKSGEAGRALCSMYETLLRTPDHPVVGQGVRARGAFIQSELSVLEARAGGLAAPASAAIGLLRRMIAKDEGPTPVRLGPGLANGMFPVPQRTAHPSSGISTLETQGVPCEAISLSEAGPPGFRTYKEFADARDAVLRQMRAPDSKAGEASQALCSLYESVLHAPNPLLGQDINARIDFVASELPTLLVRGQDLRDKISATIQLLEAESSRLSMHMTNAGTLIADSLLSPELRSERARRQKVQMWIDDWSSAGIVLVGHPDASAPIGSHRIRPMMDALLDAVFVKAKELVVDDSDSQRRFLQNRLQSSFRMDEIQTPAAQLKQRARELYRKFCLSAELPPTLRQRAYLALMNRHWPDAQAALRETLRTQSLEADSKSGRALDSVRFVPVLRTMGLIPGRTIDAAAASAVFARSPVASTRQERQARIDEVMRLEVSEVD